MGQVAAESSWLAAADVLSTTDSGFAAGRAQELRHSPDIACLPATALLKWPVTCCSLSDFDSTVPCGSRPCGVHEGSVDGRSTLDAQGANARCLAVTCEFSLLSTAEGDPTQQPRGSDRSPQEPCEAAQSPRAHIRCVCLTRRDGCCPDSRVDPALLHPGFTQWC